MPLWLAPICIAATLVAAAAECTAASPEPAAVRDLAYPLPKSSNYNSNDASRALTDFITTSGPNSSVAFVVLKGGMRVAEYYAPVFNATTQHNLTSVKKSFTSLFIGALIDEGVLALNETLAHFWPASDPVWSSVTGDVSKKQAITIRQLLTSTAGFDDPPFNFASGVPFNGGDTLEAALSFLIPVSEPGVFHYIGSANILGYAVLARTGATADAWAACNFYPFLGLSEGDYSVKANAEGVDFARNGLSITARDMAKFGQLLLQRGRASPSVSLVPAAWIDKAKTAVSMLGPESKLRLAQAIAPDESVGYGYMMWVFADIGAYCAFGASAHYICVWEEMDVVAAFAASFGTEVALASKFLRMVTESEF